ncbi:unnamed protein product [Closterium sp. NIES-54]
MVGEDDESDYEECAFAFFSPVEMPGEPATLKEALESSDAEEWKKAMESELKSIEENGTWELVELPEGRKAITSKWLFKIKSDADGKIERYKSRLVAKGYQQKKKVYQQKEKVDYKELFAPVVKPTTLRTLLAGAAIKGWVVKQMDVTTAFLNGVLEEEIFMAQPEGFDDGSGRFLRLKKALYGLKQAPRQWYLKLRGFLEEIGFTPSTADHSLFMLGEGEQRFFMVVYVDDILIFSPSSDLVKEVMLKVQDKFKCKALSDVSFYLGLHIKRDVEKWCMRVHQRKYLEALVAKFGQSEVHVATPFPSGFKCVKGPEEESVGEEERRRFHSLVGSLMYAAVNTRPDVAFATGQLARVVQCPNEEQVAAGMRVAKYLGQTPTVGLQYSAAAQRRQKGADGVESGRLFLTAFSDASFASEPEDMTSVGGFICCVGGGPTAWESKKQVDQALSSVESEYMALFRAVREIVWQRRLLAELGEEQQGPTPLYCDSQGAIALAKNPVLHGLTKHMRVKWHWTRSMLAAGEVELHYVKTTGQPADMMTKRLVEQQHWKSYCDYNTDFAAACRLNYAASLVAESASAFVCPPSVGDCVFAAASAFVAELLDFAAACHLHYATALVAESESASPPPVKGECPLSTDVFEDRREDLECLAAAVPRFASMLLVPEGDPDAPDIPAPRSYAEAITVDGMCSLPAFKVRFIARGFRQRQGVDYFQTFSPTPKMNSFQMLLHGAAQRDYELHSLDFSTASFRAACTRRCGCAAHLDLLGRFLQVPSGASGGQSTVCARRLVYVDDLVFATADTEALTLVKSEQHKRHLCTDLGELRSYLGLQITQDRARRTITLTQSHMVHQVLPRFGFQFSSPEPTPLSTSQSLSAPPLDESVEPSGLYPELVGCLVYLMTCTRPDLATSGMGLVLGGRGPVVLTGHAVASWVEDSATQRSSQGYTFSLGCGSIYWRSTLSSLVLSSSCEAEIYAGAMAAQELRWLTYLLTDLGEQPRLPPVMYVDNKAMIALCQEHRLEHRTKHIALRYFLAREL